MTYTYRRTGHRWTGSRKQSGSDEPPDARDADHHHALLTGRSVPKTTMAVVPGHIVLLGLAASPNN